MAFFLAVGALPDRLRAGLGQLRPQGAALFRPGALFALGAIGCSLAPTIEWLIVARFVQGIGACAGMTIPRAIVRDLHTGHEAARLMSLDHAGLQRVADPGAAVRQRRHRVRRLARDLLGGRADRRPRRWRSSLLRAPRDAAAGGADRRSSFGTHRAELPASCSATGISSASTFIGGFGMSSFFAFLAGVVVRLHRPFRPDADAVQPRLLGQRHRLHRHGAVRRRLGRRFGLQRVVSAALTFYLVVDVALLAG